MTHDPLRLPTLTTGQRIRVYRTRRGMTRPVLAGLVGRSAEWVKSVEVGRIHPPRLGMLNLIAKALGIPVTELLDADQRQAANLAGPAIPARDRVRDALNRPPRGIEPMPLPLLRAELARAWRVRDTALHHRTAIGPLAARLVPVAMATVEAQETRAERRAAQVLLVGACGLAQNFAANQSGGADVVWRAADRVLTAGHASGDPVALATGTRWASIAHKESGDWDTARALLDSTLGEIAPHVPDGPLDLLALYGALQSERAALAARAGEAGRAMRHPDIAEAAARGLPAAYFHSPTSFGPADIAVQLVGVDVDLRRIGSALRTAERVARHPAVPSRPRLAHHFVNVARAHRLRGDHEGTLAALRNAAAASPESTRYNPFARLIGMELLGARGCARVAAEIAVLVGLSTPEGEKRYLS
ncbi:hypothetical protein GCM10010123_14470 [Pilimelia anulata]|uniref:HTH cro/C1-type domain-containing protein n=1 Tax=Pilimelia anulata TaxID=53371 RepID=A0A8J3FBQ0_9ACTN|nr:helix-turn-helix domain-containing protein [Pilimelia anulata]GGJ85945.1 hypothetical protein GCM10010123_14470 [Pilimelia anulata]